MKVAKVISFLCLLAMTAALINGFLLGDFVEEGKVLFKNPWGIVSIVDLYVGFTLFSIWIIYREKSVFKAFFWVILMMLLGFFTGALYTFITLQTSGDDWEHFWKGKHSQKLLV